MSNKGYSDFLSFSVLGNQYSQCRKRWGRCIVEEVKLMCFFFSLKQ